MRTVTPKNAKLIPKEAKCVFKGVIYSVFQWQQEEFDGSFITYEMLKRPDTVKVICIKDDKILIVDQEQPYIGHFYDIPGGKHDQENESELEAVKRELLEETGLSFKDWKLLEVLQPSDSVEQLVYIFLATEFESRTSPSLDAGEKITVKFVDFIELKSLLYHPKSRYLPKEVINRCNNIEDLKNFPKYSDQ